MYRAYVAKCALSLLVMATAAHSATITGNIKDPSGAPIAGASVAITGVPPAGPPRTLEADASGTFRVTGLSAGHYQVRVERPGFQVFEADITAEEGKDAVVEIRLKVAEVRQEIDVPSGRRVSIDSVYRGLRESAPGDAFPVENLVFTRDNGVVTLKSGTIALTPPVLGRDTTAVFAGEGELVFHPPEPMEREHLKILTGDDSVHEPFDRALFCFTDHTGQEIRAHGKAHEADAKAGEMLRDFRHHLRTRTETPRSRLEYMLTSETMDNIEADLLADLLNPAQPGFFSAYLHGKKHADLRFEVKPRGVFPDLAPEEVGVINLDPQGEQEGIWHLGHLKSEVEQGKASSDQDDRVVRVDRYRIETVIAKNDHFTATAEIHFHAVTGGDHVIKFGLLPSLRVTRVSSGGRDVGFVQEGRRLDGSFYVILPQAMAKGSAQELTVEYQGDRVVYKAGGGNFSVGARESWYPSLNTFRDHALYDLVFKVPKEYTLVSVGKQVKEWKEQNFDCTEWSSDIPMAVAGFNYGDFKKKMVNDAQTGVELDGYAAGHAPDYLQGAEGMGATGSMSPSRLLDQALVDAENAERVFHAWFGKSEFGRIAITQQPEFNFGQSWPTLVYLPMSAFLDSTQRWQLMGRASSRLAEFVDEVTAHEVSHQWWGHEVGWSSYHDQWLSEGFAFFSAGLFLQFTEKEPAKYIAYWQHAREAVTEKNGFGRRANDAGPLWFGVRLDSEKNADAYNALVYRKGGYILHMLRSLMYDAKDGDRPFIEMMKDFVATYRNATASTEDFQRIAEKHIRPPMNLKGDGKLDWFFSEWVYGSTLPKYKFDYTVTPEADGKWLLHANLTQSEVPADFQMQVPVYVDLDGQMRRIGQIRMIGSTSATDIKVRLPSKPRKVAINAFHDVLEQ